MTALLHTTDGVHSRGDRRRVLFVTYTRLVPITQIGVFKRCLRLMDVLREEFELHLVNFGPLLHGDALFARLAPSVQIHALDDADLGNQLQQLLATLAPDAVVLGETPLRGSMRLAYRVAKAAGAWQICIDNFYGQFVEELFPIEWPAIDRWLLLGLRPEHATVRSAPGIAITAPLVRFPEGHGRDARDRVVILGYDKQTLLMGLRLVRRLPSGLRVDILTSPEWQELLDRSGWTESPPTRRTLILPEDTEIYACLSRAAFALGKAGYQQIVESACFGTPILAQICGGGVDSSLIAPHLQPFVRLIATEADLDRAMISVAGWLLDGRRPVPPDLGAPGADPVTRAAMQLLTWVDEGQRARNLVRHRPAPEVPLAQPQSNASA